MNKQDLFCKIAEVSKIPKSHAEILVGNVFHIIANSIAEGEQVKIKGFGTFVKVERKARKKYNPQTKKMINIEAYSAPKFRAGKELKELLR